MDGESVREWAVSFICMAVGASAVAVAGHWMEYYAVGVMGTGTILAVMLRWVCNVVSRMPHRAVKAAALGAYVYGMAMIAWGMANTALLHAYGYGGAAIACAGMTPMAFGFVLPVVAMMASPVCVRLCGGGRA